MGSEKLVAETGESLEDEEERLSRSATKQRLVNTEETVVVVCSYILQVFGKSYYQSKPVLWPVTLQYVQKVCSGIVTVCIAVDDTSLSPNWVE
jgi:hypothetical protein